MATDIAFALAVLAVAGSAFPPALRIFLLTLAVVDDLGAIVVIAVVYTSSLELAPLAAAVACLAAYAFLQWRRVHAWWLYVPIALATWGFVHASGIHATVAGVALGLLTRVRVDPGQELAPADRLDHYLRPVSAGFAVPIFALLAAGVPFGAEAIHDVLTDRIGLGIVVGLVVGKFVGVLGGSYLSTRFGLARLSDDLGWRDMTCVAVLTGVGFTVSLLICELAYPGTHIEETAKAAVLIASLLASVIAVLMLRKRSKVHRDAVSEDANSVAG
jgi:NhaA family Na+:H+ antiporter